MLLFLLSAFGVYGQQEFSLSGVVTDTLGQPVENAIIHLEGATGITLSGRDGSFFISGLSYGKHHFCTRRIGFTSFIDTIFFDKNVKNYAVVLRSEAMQLETVTITENSVERQRRQESANVSVVGTEYLSGNREGSLMKTLSSMPGISSLDIGSGESKPQIRGLGFNRVVVAENGIKHEGQQWGHDHGMEIDQFGVESVEVIKGPASLVYGSDAIGGVINIKPFTVPVDDGFTGEITLHTKSNNALLGTSVKAEGRKNNRFFSARITALANGDYQVPTDTVSYNTYDFILKNGYLKNTAGRELNGFVAGGFSWKKGITTISFGNYYRKSGFYADAHGFEIRNSEIDFLKSSRDIDLPYQQVNHVKVAANTTLFFDNHKLDISIGYQNNHRREYSEPMAHGYMPAPDGTLEREFNKDIWHTNIAMNHIFSEAHSMTAGINSGFQNNRRGGWGFIIPSFRQITTGVFVYDKYKILQNLTLNVGLRYDAGYIETDAYHDWFLSPVFDETGTPVGMDYIERSTDLKKQFGNFTWSGGASYNPGKWLLKLNLGKSFRMPDARELAANGVNYQLYRQEKGDSTITSETAWQADLLTEYKTAFTTIALTPFFTWFPDYIYLNPTNRFSQETGLQEYIFVQNQVVRWGTELEVVQKVPAGLQLGAGVEYVYSEQLSGEKKGFGLPFSPPLSAIFTLKWALEFTRKVVNDVYLQVEAVVANQQNRIVPPEEITDGYNVYHFLAGGNIQVGRQPVNWNFQIQNIFNTKYFNHTSYYRIVEIPEPGRNFQLTFNIKF